MVDYAKVLKGQGSTLEGGRSGGSVRSDQDKRNHRRIQEPRERAKAWNEAGGGWEDAVMSRLLRELRARLSTALYLGLALGLVYFCLPKDVRPAVVRDRNYAEHDITLSLEEKANETWVEVISWSPRAFLVHNLFTDAEADHVVEMSRDHLKRSLTKGGGKEDAKRSKFRTSDSSSLEKYQTRVVAALEERVAILLSYPALHQESLKVLRYNPGQLYKPHFDAFSVKKQLPGDSNRAATVILYLTEVEEGGETNFPRAKLDIGYDRRHRDRMERTTSCDGGRMWRTILPFEIKLSSTNTVTPKKGSALVFYDLDPAANYIDDDSLHEGCPVISGEKWSATLWVRTGSPLEALATPHTKRRVKDLFGAKLEVLRGQGKKLRSFFKQTRY